MKRFPMIQFENKIFPKTIAAVSENNVSSFKAGRIKYDEWIPTGEGEHLRQTKEAGIQFRIIVFIVPILILLTPIKQLGTFV
jgi:hypothetical protein